MDLGTQMLMKWEALKLLHFVLYCQMLTQIILWPSACLLCPSAQELETFHNTTELSLTPVQVNREQQALKLETEALKDQRLIDVAGTKYLFTQDSEANIFQHFGGPS